MKLKVRPADFKVTERLAEGVLKDGGGHRVYRVQKEKVTSLEAATELAAALGITSADIGMAGLKDRQGVTTQFMSVQRGPTLSLDRPGLNIRDVGFASEALTAADSIGNEFQIVVRDLGTAEVDHARAALDEVRDFGLPNYFDGQRFGNLRHGQGWIALDLVRGDISGALKRLIASASPHEPPARRSLKDALWRNWGDWNAARSIAGKLGRYHSLFEHLKRDPEDFVGAFERVATRERLIHLYAFQSHLFNRALALFVQECGVPSFSTHGIEGPLRFPRIAPPIPPAWQGMLMMPGAELSGIEDEQQWGLYERVLSEFGLRPDELRLPELPGFILKPEPRAVLFTPDDLRLRPAEDDNLFRGRKMLRLKFSLPRGAYATLVVRRLIGPSSSGTDDRPRRRDDEGSEGYGGGSSRRGGSRRRGAPFGGARRGGGRRGGFGRGDAEGGSFGRDDFEGDDGGGGQGRGGARRGGSRRGGGRGRGGPRRGGFQRQDGGRDDFAQRDSGGHPGFDRGDTGRRGFEDDTDGGGGPRRGGSRRGGFGRGGPRRGGPGRGGSGRGGSSRGGFGGGSRRGGGGGSRRG